MSQVPTRDQIDEQYTWDLTALFESPDEWREEKAAAEARLDDLRDLEGDITDGEALLEALQSLEAVRRRVGRLALYAQLRRNEDTTDPERQERLHRSNRLAQEVTKATAAVRRAIQMAGRTELDSWVDATDGLAAFEPYLEDARRLAPHARSPEVEELLADLQEPLESPTRVYTTLTSNDIDPEPVVAPGPGPGPDGDDDAADDSETVEATGVNLETHLRHPDRDFRRRAYQSVYGAYADVADTIATAYADKVTAQVALAEARNYDSVREMAFNRESYPETGLHIQLPTEVHDVAMAALADSLEPVHRRADLRRTFLGLDELRPWDTGVPLLDCDPPAVPYDEARGHILAAVEALGADYRDRLAALFDDRRFDVYETRRKQDIVAYAPWAYDTGPYVLMNYGDDLRSMAILAHELGHAMHAEHLREARSPLTATGPRPVEEVPSFVHELLLADHLLDADDPALRRAARLRQLGVGGTLYGAGMWSMFTHRTYRAVEDGEALTRDRIEGIYTDLRAEFRPSMPIDEWATRGWLKGSHAREPYHFYQYVLGATGALRTVERLREGSLSPAAYRDFLRGGGAVRSVEAFDRLGIDVTSRAAFERACAAYGRQVAALAER